jgi:hypothetical protein
VLRISELKHGDNLRKKTCRQNLCIKASISVADPESLSWIPDPGSRVDKIPDPDPLKKRIYVFLTQKTDTKFSKITSGTFIPDPDSGLFPSRIPDPRGKKAPDPGTRIHTMVPF